MSTKQCCNISVHECFVSKIISIFKIISILKSRYVKILSISCLYRKAVVVKKQTNKIKISHSVYILGQRSYIEISMPILGTRLFENIFQNLSL